MNALIRYPGAKWRLSEWIISKFPQGYEEMVYIEPFCGSAAVFFQKNPSTVETINDLNSDIVNLFRVLREQPEELKHVIERTPFSREEYDLAFELCDEPIEKARRFLIRQQQAIGNKIAKMGWRNHYKLNVGGTAAKWIDLPVNIEAAAKRLRGAKKNFVQIEHKNAFDLIERYNHNNCLMYLDPPYVQSTRKQAKIYSNEVNDEMQHALLNLIKKSKSYIAISGYDSELYDDALKEWNRYEKEAFITSGEHVREILWTNYEPPQRQIEWNLESHR